MKRRIILLFALTAIWLSVKAQSYYCDIWFDANRSTLTHSMCTLGENEVTVDLSVMPWPGLHYLNIVPHSEAGEAAPWKIIPIILPEGWPHSVEANSLEYWLTGYNNGKPKYVPYRDEGAIALDLDLGSISGGLHFLNLRVMSETGYPGPRKIIPVIMPEGWPNSTDASTLEYWVTGYDNNPRSIPGSEGAIALDIDVSRMSVGLHFLNYRVLSETGYPGPWQILPFYLSEGSFGEEEMHYDYWIDSEVTTKSGTALMPGTLDLDVKTSQLSDGEHTFNFKACNLMGTYGELFSTTFEVMDGLPVGLPDGIEDVTETQEKRLTIRAEDGVLVVDSNTERDISIYQTNGMLVRKVHLAEGQNIVRNLRPNIYIVEGLKFILR